MTPVVIAFGSNLGDRESAIAKALRELDGPLQAIRVSSLYETEPLLVGDQPPFLNGALLAETELGPRALLALLKATELKLGRRPRERYGPREIDLDLIVYGSLILRSTAGATLALPHPRLAERRFVLEPLVEVAPDLVVPGMGTATDLLRNPSVLSQDVQKVTHAPIRLPRP